MITDVFNRLSPVAQMWIAECMLNNVDEATMVSTMSGTYDVPPDIARSYLAILKKHPLFLTAAKVQHELDKRDWLLDILGTSNRLSKTHHHIERIDDITLEEFLEHYYAPNRPVILTKNAIKDWKALETWSFDYFRQRWGNVEVEVQTGRESNPRYDQEHSNHTKTMTFAQYIDMIESVEASNDFYMTSRNMGKHKEALLGIVDDIQPLPAMLNPNINGTVAFLWMGPKGTKTQLHHDISSNLHTQVVGSKRFLMADPYQLPFMYHYNCYWSKVPYPDEPDLKQYPLFEHTRFTEVILEPGESIFIPILWWHYVEAVKPSITLAFHNFRFHNIYPSFDKNMRFQYHQD